MPNLTRVKRRMIRQAVRENFDTIRGCPPKAPGKWPRALLTAARLFFLIGLPIALFSSSYLLSTIAAPWHDEMQREGVVRPLRLYRPAMLATSESLPPIEAESRLLSPRPIDPAVLPLALRTVVLDPGHGGENRGTMAPFGLVEKEVTLDIARRARQLLESSSFAVIMTREDDRHLSLKERAEAANQARGDIFVSIHVNWLDKPEARGVETFFLGATDDPYLEALAARENRDSGYSLADFREILEQVYAGVRQEQSRNLASAVQQALYEALSRVNGSVTDRGVKSAPFGVLTHTEMPAILAEVSSVSNDVEARLLTTPIYRQYLAEAMVAGIQAYSDRLSQTERIGG